MLDLVQLRFLTATWLVVLLCALVLPVDAADRDAEAAAAAALGHAEDMELPPRPANLTDFTKGEVVPPVKDVGVRTLNIGATGIVGIPNAWYDGEQIQVAAVLPGSPAEGVVLPGDVILGVAGQDFVVGGHIGIQLGNALIAAEEEAGEGRFDLHIWRDLNWAKRGAPKDMLGVDLDDLFAKANAPQLYEWEEPEEREVSLKNAKYDEYPIDGVETNVTLQLEVMGTYSDTSPWNCPVATKIRENALKVVAEEFTPKENRKQRKRPDWPGVLALVASGNPAYVKLAKDWVHAQTQYTQDMELKTDLSDMKYKGMQSWRAGFEALEQAIYYDATGDAVILPEIRKRAIWTAMGQSAGGSWGHTFAYPSFNGGKLHMRNPGYGGMNNAGTRCFFLLTLASKFGIEHPEIDLAIDRATRFFRTYVDKGCIPYGDHPPWPSDDSNGKNYGATYAFKTLGLKYEAKYFAMHSANAAFSRRGGHGSPTLWYYTPFSGAVAGPKGIVYAMRNLRWFYTLARRHDGSFVWQGKQAGISGDKGMRNPTATHAMYYAFPLKQLIITGKDADKACWMHDEDLKQLFYSAGGQITDPMLKKLQGGASERTTDEVVALLHHFFPKVRGGIAKQLGSRFEAGEKDVVTKVLPLLDSGDARTRDGACLTLAACGKEVVLQNLSKITALLDDPAEFVRMNAIKTIANATEPTSSDRHMLLLKAAVANFDNQTMDNGNDQKIVKEALLTQTKDADGPQNPFVTNPFDMGYDYDLVRSALENVVTLDPGGTVPDGWTREAVVQLAGPIEYVASSMQMNDMMFAGGRQAAGRALLKKYDFRELAEGDTRILRDRVRLERDVRRNVEFFHRRRLKAMGNVTLSFVKENPSAYREMLDAMHQWLQDKPLDVVHQSDASNGYETETMWLGDVVALVENAGRGFPQSSLRDEVFTLFAGELAALEGAGAQVSHCRKVLRDPNKKDYFRKLAAMQHLKDLLGADAVVDVAPYLGHGYWRLREESHKLAVDLLQKGGLDALISSLPSAKGENAAAMLLVLRDAGDKKALAAVAKALKRDEGVVRKAAIQALIALAGTRALPPLWQFMERTTDAYDLWGCELALLSRRDDAAFCELVLKEAMDRLPNSTIPVRRSLAWVIAQLGDAENLTALQAAAAKSDDKTDVRNIVVALSYAPDRAADDLMLALAEVSRMHLDAVAHESMRRMVGPKGLQGITDQERVAFARGMLNLKLDSRMIQYLGHVYTGSSIQLLFDVMQTSDKTNLAATSIISAAEGMQDPPADEARIAADALTQVIEFIEVNYLRGGMQAHMAKEDNYLGWKNLQARAGKVLLKVHKPEAAPIPTFDDMDLDF